MELINENDLQNVCGGSCKEALSTLVTAGAVLIVCGVVTYAILEDDLDVETVLRVPVKKQTVVTEKTYYNTYII